MGTLFKDEEIMDDLVEYESTRLASDKRSKEALDRIAGGEYWVDIIEDYQKGTISVYEAEARFADEYCARMRQSYNYVLNMPLRIKRGQVPKYRMIHATNHPAGALIMVDNIFGRWELMRDIQTDGQQSFWEENVDNELIDNEGIREKVINHLSGISAFTKLNLIMADFYCTYGVLCPTKNIKDIYRDLEKEGAIEVRRNPAQTSTGRSTSFFADEKGKTTELRWNRCKA